ncbi:hypothetical protein BCU83_18245 [Vibrio breoganii]|uniref:FAD-dependent oxidoreductase n=1 Tax=Vibrio breoganii TaxID=553239 RepID=UPI000C819A0D|nr:FAD-dependent oxidoreductase [Vibrio breoganii]PMG85573.1 hypothetical protein BCU83_18245 [Vibrio breoganii]
MAISRRTLLKSAAGVGVLGATGLAIKQSNAIKTNAHIAIVGGGAAGIGIANMLNRYLDGAKISVIEPRDYHWYQPGQTLLLAGSYSNKSDVVSPITRYIGSDINWIQDSVTELNPDSNSITTAKGSVVSYDYLIVSAGLELRYDLIEGLSTDDIGQDGIASIYYSPESGLSSFKQAHTFVEQPGRGNAVFTRPQGAMKCAGAPLKATNLVEYFAQQSPNRSQFNFQYYTSEAALFAVTDFDLKLKEIWEERAIYAYFEHVLTALDKQAKTATFTQQNGAIQKVDWDFIHVVPPMLPPQVIRESSLADQSKYKGYVEVNPLTLQHKRYANVFAMGDCVGTPIGKTAASVKSQLPVVTDNLCALLEGRSPTSQWSGYTSCPMILDVGHAMLWEFDYSMKPMTALPFQVVDPLAESALAWRMEETFLRPVYDVMLKGYTPI